MQHESSSSGIADQTEILSGFEATEIEFAAILNEQHHTLTKGSGLISSVLPVWFANGLEVHVFAGQESVSGFEVMPGLKLIWQAGIWVTGQCGAKFDGSGGASAVTEVLRWQIVVVPIGWGC